MLIFDAHLDMAWNALEYNRNLMLPVSEIRRFEKHFTDIVPGANTVSWVDLHRGGVGITISTLLPRLHRKDKPLSHFQSREAAYGICQGQLAYYRAMVERGVLREISDRATLERHVAEWERRVGFQPAGQEQPGFSEDIHGQAGSLPYGAADSTRSVPATLADGTRSVPATLDGGPPIGYILSMEGSPSVLSPAQIPHWYEAGLRILGPAHYGPGPYCHGTGSEGGLTADGPALLKEMDKVGMLLDVTHLADQSFWEALDIFQGPVLASHHNCRALVPGDRQLADEQIKALIERGAVIGASFDAWMIKPGWKIGVSDPKSVSMEDLANHTDHICQLAGSARHCGIGSDLDGGFGKEQTPHDLDTIADLGRFAEILSRRGYSADDIEAIMYKNWVNFFRRAWSANQAVFGE